MSLNSPVDNYGFKRPPNFDYDAHEEFIEYYLPILRKRQRRWKRLSRRDRSRKSRKLKRYIRKGIPKSERPMMWMLTSGAKALRENSEVTYKEMKSLALQISNIEIVKQINKDIPRTFTQTNIFFKPGGILLLKVFNICTTFAHQNDEVKYCQSLTEIAGFLLLIIKDEEMSFWVLKALIEEILPKYYTNTLSGLLTDFAVLDELVHIKDRALHSHLKNIDFRYDMIITRWLMILYVEFLPTETVLRIWDCLLYEGSQILLRVALLLIKMHRKQLLCTDDFVQARRCFQNMAQNSKLLNCHSFMKKIFSLRVSSCQLEKLRRKHANAESK